MRHVLTTIALLFPQLTTVDAAEKTQPNFVIVIGDDVGWDAFGCTGTQSARTPNIDKLAAQSLHMERFYCSVSQCAPLRAEMYTGLLPNNNGVLANARKVSRPGVKNVADHLKPLGYRIGWTGKKHFGLGQTKLDNITGFPGGGNDSNKTYSLDGVRDYIKESQSGGDPFCVFICSIHAHHPWDHGKESNFPTDKLKLPPHYIDTPAARQAIAKHAAEVEVLDRQVGDTAALLRTLEVDDNTVLIFLSEQGIAMPRGKWSPYDYGSRALCLAHWPGKIAPRKTNAIAMYCDIVPTLVDLAGGADPQLDGRSLQSVWLDGQDEHRDAAFISNVHPFWQKAIVTQEYKLVWSAEPKREHIWSNFTSAGKFFSKPWTEWTAKAETDKAAAAKLKHVLHPDVLELYRIDKDPYEVHNLATDSQHAKTIAKLHTQLKELMTAAGESLEPSAGNDRRKKPKNGASRNGAKPKRSGERPRKKKEGT